MPAAVELSVLLLLNRAFVYNLLPGNAAFAACNVNSRLFVVGDLEADSQNCTDQQSFADSLTFAAFHGN